MSLEDKVKQLELENAKLKRRNIRLVKEYNSLLSIAVSLNNHLKDYRNFATKLAENTDTFVLGQPKKFKEEI